MTFAQLVARQLAEVREDRTRPACTSLHQAYGLLAEEMAELLDEIRRRHQCGLNVRSELVDIAMICQRAAEDLGLVDP